MPDLGPIFEFSERFVTAYSERFPVAASMAGVARHFGTWDDYTPEGVARALAFFRETLSALAELGPGESPWDKLATRVLADFVSERIRSYEAGDPLIDLNNIDSPMQHFRMVFDAMELTTEAGLVAAAERLERLPSALAAYRSGLEAGLALGKSPAKRQVAATILQAESHASPSSSFGELLTTYDAYAKTAASPHPELRARIARGVEVVRQAFKEMAVWLEGFKARARTDDAFGREGYLRSCERFLGGPIDLDETYAWGFEEIRAIERKMVEVSAKIDPSRSVREVILQLKSDPKGLVADHNAFIVEMAERQQAALNELSKGHFDIPAPLHTIVVKLAPKGGALGAYYVPPSDGFSRPGTVYYAPAEGEPFARFSEVSTAYHEGFPGHHLQCGLQVYLADRLSQFHRLFVVYSGYAEGWALYAEELMDELGYLDRPEYVLGMHMQKLFRAYRVVADIGMHLGLKIPEDFNFHPGETWSAELTTEALIDRVGLPRDFAESETTRYLGWPGQAISYKVGERSILALRERAKASLGANFDLRAFHQAVLGCGSVGLSHLDELVADALGLSKVL